MLGRLPSAFAYTHLLSQQRSSPEGHRDVAHASVEHCDQDQVFHVTQHKRSAALRFTILRRVWLFVVNLTVEGRGRALV